MDNKCTLESKDDLVNSMFLDTVNIIMKENLQDHEFEYCIRCIQGFIQYKTSKRLSLRKEPDA